MTNPRIFCSLVCALATVPFMGCGEKGADSFEQLTSNLTISCGNSLMQGTWNSIDDVSRNDVLTLGPGCQGKSTYCGSEFSFASESGNLDFVMYVSRSNGKAGCPAVGQRVCTFAVTQVVNVPAGPMAASSAEINCGEARIYARIGPPS